MGKPIQGRRFKTVIDNPGEVLPTSVQKSYFMLSEVERAVLTARSRNIGLGSLNPF